MEVRGRWISVVNKLFIVRLMRKYDVGFLKFFSGLIIMIKRSKVLVVIVIKDNMIMYMVELKRNFVNFLYGFKKIFGFV